MSRLESDLFNYKSKYEYPNGVLINKLGYDNQNDLDTAERMITTRKIALLQLQPIKPPFNVKHYLDIHKYLFEDIYPFAGEIRSENIYKSFSFCPPQHIYNELNRTLNDATSKVKYIDSKDKLLSFIIPLYSDLDVIHPFREGNGRTLRVFIGQFIKYICKTNNLEPYKLDYTNLDSDRYITAIRKADAYLDYSDLTEIFNEILIIDEKAKTK